MQQFWDIKNKHLDKILLFRMGDFYEMFFDDAIKAAPILNIALTSRSKSQGQDVPMCGVPHHAIGPQINKLLGAGLKVAICDQVESAKAAKEAKTIVKRAVTRIVTPGLAYDPEALEASVSLYVASIGTSQTLSNFDLVKTELAKSDFSKFDFAALDSSTGEVLFAKDLDSIELSSWIQKLAPKEYVLEPDLDLPFALEGVITRRIRSENQNIEDFLLSYVQETQGPEVVKTLCRPELLVKDFLKISPTSMRHLEIFKTTTGDTFGSVFETVNLTKTPMGARLLKKKLATPFMLKNQILDEQALVSFYYDQSEIRKEVRLTLSKLGDMERKIAKLSNPVCNARDLQALARSLCLSIQVLKLVNENSEFEQMAHKLELKITKTLLEDLPHSTKEGHLVKPGVNSLLDEFVDLATHAQTRLTQLEAHEKSKSGIQNLRIKYNSVSGYSFEITKSNLDRIPPHFIRKQTLAAAERFVTQDLVDLEEKILTSEQKRNELEFEIFDELKKECLEEALKLLEMAHIMAQIDVRTSFAELAFEQNYCKPCFDDSGLIRLEGSRHSVLERLSREPFISNDISLAPGECILLTGPNMAGKSTLMRQVALTAILAQCGAFVPATKALLPLFDQIFTRIGASDHLVSGLSTFMVEMTETAAIISAATTKSLVILDEIGRGTSTYDGMSLAQAVLEYFSQNVGSYTFFATHYHELAELEKDIPRIMNRHMAIEEHQGELIFLRKLVQGVASRSYGIEVAKLAGLPQELTKRAQLILKGITSKTKELKNKQLDLISFELPQTCKHEDILKEVKAIQVNTLTPLEALNKLSAFQKSIQ